MVGYRKTHNYPHGKPHPLVWLNVATALVALSWVFLVPGHWPRAIGILAVFAVLAVIDTKLHGHYERTCQAVRIARPRVAAKFPKGLPVPMMTARAGFFAVVGMMLLLGVVPLSDSVARAGIIVCVFALIAVAVLNLALEHHYVRNGKATEVDLADQSHQT